MLSSGRVYERLSQLTERGQSLRFLFELRKEAKLAISEALTDFVDRLRLDALGDLVDDQLAHGNPGLVQRFQGVLRLGDGQRFREQDPGKRGALRISQQLRHLAALLFELDDQLVRLIGLVGSAKALREDSMALFESVEDAGEAAEQLRHLQQTEGVGCGRRVHHHQIRFALAREARQLEQGDQLVGSWQGKAEQPVDVLLVQIGSALGDLAQGLAPIPEPTCEGVSGIQLCGQQGALADHDRSGLGGQPKRESVAERVGRIGGDDEGARAALSGGEGRGGGTGGLADAPLAAEEAEGGKRYGSSSWS